LWKRCRFGAVDVGYDYEDFLAILEFLKLAQNALLNLSFIVAVGGAAKFRQKRLI